MQMKAAMQLKVGELAARSGLTVRTLHHYDEIGLLKPSGRSESGYRLYSRADVERLHGIQALRQLGLPLAEIGPLLAGEGAGPQRILEQQILALDREVARATELRARLHLMRDSLAAGGQPDMGDWLDTLALMTTFGRYFSAAELKRIFGDFAKIEDEFEPLKRRVREAMDAGAPPDSARVQQLAARWMALMMRWMDGDLDLMERWGHMYRSEPTTHGRMNAPPGDMIAYIESAIQLRVDVISRYLSREDFPRMRFVPLADWQVLEDRVQALLRVGADPASPAARAAAAQWAELMDRFTGHDPRLRERMREAWAREPLLRAGSPLSEPVRDFLERAGDAAPTAPPPAPAPAGPPRSRRKA